jgi:hypothetical protein
MKVRFSTSLSLAALTATLTAPEDARASQSSILNIRQGNFSADIHRVVFDMSQLPQAAPSLSHTATGWRIAITNSDGDKINTDVHVPDAKQIKRTFFLPKTKDKPARLVMDFEAAPTKTTPEQIEALFGLPAIQPASGEVQRLQLSGFAEAEGRWFPRASDDGVIRKLFGSLAVEPSLKFQLSDNHKLTLTGFGRIDTALAARSHGDVREAKYEGRFGAVGVTLGIDRRFWGQLEAGHLVDIINQIDQLEDIDGEDKLGQPLAEVKCTGSKASLSLLALPYFRDRAFAQAQDRPNMPQPVTAKPIYDGTTSRWTPDFAARGTLTTGPVDLALHYFNGLHREPRLIFGPEGLTPVYDRISQVGVDALAVLGPVRLKAEAYHRKPRNDKVAAAPSYSGFGLGAEYTFAGALGAADVNLLAEYYHDSRGREATTIFDSDVFAGFRYSGNDMASTEVLGGVLIDMRRSSKFVTLEASRRLNDAFKISLDARLPMSVAPEDPLWMMRDDGFVQVKLQYHF